MRCKSAYISNDRFQEAAAAAAAFVSLCLRLTQKRRMTMKRFLIAVMAVLLFAGLLPGCVANGGEEASGTDAETTQKVDVTQLPSGSAQTTVPTDGLTKGEGASEIAIGATGSSRVDYAGNISSARYITSADQLPAYAQLQGYDEAYFQEHALLVVLETVNSGAVQVDIESISVEGSNAMVRLSHERAGDVSTAVMTTWLVWAELDAGLDYKWKVQNPAVQDETQRY